MNTVLYELKAGQALHLVIRRGDSLLVQRGRLEARSRAESVSGTLVIRRETWPEAYAFEAQASHVWHCLALAPTTLVLHRRRTLLHCIGARLRRLATSLKA